MGFKSDREFLRNITIGAVGTRRVARVLRQAGYRIIELERCATSNKIWTTKVKRLRVPDLLCIKSGIRIESRAKSKLKITMSHAVKNTERAWDGGLRDDDLVAFIRCSPSGATAWVPSSNARFFYVRDMRATVDAAGVSQMKAASEGSEIQLTWPAKIPGRSGEVVTVSEDNIEMLQDSGRRQRYKLIAKKGTGSDARDYKLHAYVRSGQRIEAGDQIIASVIPEIASLGAPSSGQYDFIADLVAPERETAYAAAKALGHLAESCEQSVDPLQRTLVQHDHALVRLEAAGALARLGVDSGWDYLQTVLNSEGDQAMCMETVLILGELGNSRSSALLRGVAAGRANDSELRGAAAWSLSETSREIDSTALFDLLGDEDETTAVHALVSASRGINEDTIEVALQQLGSDRRRSAGIVQAIILSGHSPVNQLVQLLRSTSGSQRGWLLYLIGRLGRQRFEEQLTVAAPDVLEEIEFFWQHQQENWTNRLDVADQIDFQASQVLPD